MSLFDELMKHEAYKKLFENYPEDQRQYIIDSLKNFVDNTEINLLVPVKNIVEATKKSDNK
jgi:hypothetical protein